jgi:hypothetical protein
MGFTGNCNTWFAVTDYLVWELNTEAFPTLTFSFIENKGMRYKV